MACQAEAHVTQEVRLRLAGHSGAKLRRDSLRLDRERRLWLAKPKLTSRRRSAFAWRGIPAPSFGVTAFAWIVSEGYGLPSRSSRHAGGPPSLGGAFRRQASA